MPDLPDAALPAAPDAPAALPRLALIAAVARNGVIGDGQGMPWHLPEDLAHFKRTTLGQPVLMGRRTWESLPPRFRPLPGRRNLVLTRQAGWHAEGAEPVASLKDALAACAGAPWLWVIGGGAVYEAALPRADRLVLTEIDAVFAGSVHFPAFNRAEFVETHRQRVQAAAPNAFALDFVTWDRVPSAPPTAAAEARTA